MIACGTPENVQYVPHIVSKMIPLQNFKGRESRVQKQKQKDILLAVPKSIYKNLVVLDCNWTHCAVKLKSPLHINPS
jgi:hypothetical protein